MSAESLADSPSSANLSSTSLYRSDRSRIFSSIKQLYFSAAFEPVKKYAPLVAAIVFLYVVSSILYVMISGKADLSSATSGLVWVALLAVSLYGSVHFFLSFAHNLRKDVSEDSNSASICLVEVSINNETVLTVRSWWPIRMSSPDVERHGVRVAMSSARRWLVDNAQGRVKKVRFTECVAREICQDYLCDTTMSNAHCSHNEKSQCSVCLDDIETGVSGVSMKKCGHVFHQDCLSAWIAQSSRLACVICRADHSDLLPQFIIKEHTVKEDPVISVLTVAIEQGSLAGDSH